MASWHATVTALVKTIVGAGVLALPFAFAQTGYLAAVALLSLAAAAQLFALHLLAQLSLAAADAPSYRAFALEAFGSAAAAAAAEAINGIHCFALATACLIVLGDLCPALAHSHGAHARRASIGLLGLGLELPLLCRRSLRGLRHTSAIGNAAVALLAALTALFAAGVLHPAAPPSVRVGLLPPQGGASPLASHAGVLGVFVFSFECAMNVPTLVVEMEQPSARRVESAVSAGVGLSLVAYLLIGGCGAAAFGAAVSPNLLLSFPAGEADKLADGCAVAARLAMLLSVAFTYPLMMHPARNSAALVLFSQPAASLNWEQRGLLTLGLFACSVMVAMLVESLDLALGLVGGSTGILIGFVFPALFYYQIKGRQMDTQDMADDGATDSRRFDLDLERSTAYRLIDRGRTRRMRMGACAMAVGGMLLIPVLVGAQVLQIISATHESHKHKTNVGYSLGTTVQRLNPGPGWVGS